MVDFLLLFFKRYLHLLFDVFFLDVVIVSFSSPGGAVFVIIDVCHHPCISFVHIMSSWLDVMSALRVSIGTNARLLTAILALMTFSCLKIRRISDVTKLAS